MSLINHWVAGSREPCFFATSLNENGLNIRHTEEGEKVNEGTLKLWTICVTFVGF